MSSEVRHFVLGLSAYLIFQLTIRGNNQKVANCDPCFAKRCVRQCGNCYLCAVDLDKTKFALKNVDTFLRHTNKQTVIQTRLNTGGYSIKIFREWIFWLTFDYGVSATIYNPTHFFYTANFVWCKLILQMLKKKLSVTVCALK